MLKLLYTWIFGIIGAAVVHLAILFLLPEYSTKDGWSRLSSVADIYEIVRLPDTLSATLPTSENPFIEAAACRFQLEDGPLHVRSLGTAPFWSLALFDKSGINTYSINHRASTDSVLDVVVTTSAQMQKVDGEILPDLSEALLLETTLLEGFVLVRSFVPDPTWQSAVDSFLDDLRCSPVTLAEADPSDA